jgi:hypothetical protein
VVFNTLGVKWVYELQHYDFGVKVVWEGAEFREYLQEALAESGGEDEEDVIRGAYRHRYEKRMYLPDFWLPDFAHWVEVKGKAPTWEEQRKASALAQRTGKPVSIVWNHIFPYPEDPNVLWGDCTEIYGGEYNIIALLAIDYGVRRMERALAAARHARFSDEENEQN